MAQIDRSAKAIGLALVVTLAGCDPAKGPADAIFEYVGAAGRWEDAGHIDRKFADPRAVPRYLIVHDRLYLLTQITQPHLIDVDVVEQPAWPGRDLTDLLQKHPELRRHLAHGTWIHAP